MAKRRHSHVVKIVKVDTGEERPYNFGSYIAALQYYNSIIPYPNQYKTLTRIRDGFVMESAGPGLNIGSREPNIPEETNNAEGV